MVDSLQSMQPFVVKRQRPKVKPGIGGWTSPLRLREVVLNYEVNTLKWIVNALCNFKSIEPKRIRLLQAESELAEAMAALREETDRVAHIGESIF